MKFITFENKDDAPKKSRTEVGAVVSLGQEPHQPKDAGNFKVFFAMGVAAGAILFAHRSRHR